MRLQLPIDSRARNVFPQEKQRAARARKQRMLEMEVEAKKKALKSDIEVSARVVDCRVAHSGTGITAKASLRVSFACACRFLACSGLVHPPPPPSADNDSLALTDPIKR